MTRESAALPRILALCAQAPSLVEFRAQVLNALREAVPFDAAMFHALSPRVPLETGAFVGFDMNALARSRAQWDHVAVELGAMREQANQQIAVRDDDVFPPGSKARARFETHVTRPFRMRSLCIVHLMVRGAVHAAIVLCAKKPQSFSTESVRWLREVAPALAAADALHTHLDGAQRTTTPARMRCLDQRLTPKQREIVEHVALGETNAEIAQVMGLSPNTLRNHLARVFAKIGASNRADLVRLAVLVGSATGSSS